MTAIKILLSFWFSERGKGIKGMKVNKKMKGEGGNKMHSGTKKEDEKVFVISQKSVWERWDVSVLFLSYNSRKVSSAVKARC